MRDTLALHTMPLPATSQEISLLLYAAGPSAEEAARMLRRFVTPSVSAVSGQIACLRALQQSPCTLLLLEESAATSDPVGTAAIYEAAGDATVLEVNFGIADSTRLVLQTRAALRHRDDERRRARAAARVELQNELMASLTGLLLESQLAMRQAGPELAPALHRLAGLAETICERLRAEEFPA